MELKNVVSEEASIPVAKIKVLCNKKPVPDSKTVSELVGEDGGQLELGLMILGGAASIVPREPAATKAPTQEKKEEVPTRAMEDVKMVDSPGPDSEKVQPAEPQVCGRGVLSSEEFWNDLHGFLLQRLKDESMADDLTKKFRGAI